MRSHIPHIPLIPPVAASQKECAASPRVELMGLINVVGALYGFTPAETAEATEIAFADPEGALASYRDVATRYALNVPADDRVTCDECSWLLRGRCQAAKLGLLKDTQPDYAPVLDTPHRCEHFKKRMN